MHHCSGKHDRECFEKAIYQDLWWKHCCLTIKTEYMDHLKTQNKNQSFKKKQCWAVAGNGFKPNSTLENCRHCWLDSSLVSTLISASQQFHVLTFCHSPCQAYLPDNSIAQEHEDWLTYRIFPNPQNFIMAKKRYFSPFHFNWLSLTVL